MIYNPPFYAVTRAVNQALKAQHDLEWFETNVPMPKIEEHFKNQTEYAFGIFGTSTADCTANKSATVWQTSLFLEIYSNYRGRKVLSIHLARLLNYLSSDEGWEALKQPLAEDGFNLESVSVGTMTINMPVYGESGTWLSGSTTVTFKLTQRKE